MFLEIKFSIYLNRRVFVMILFERLKKNHWSDATGAQANKWPLVPTYLQYIIYTLALTELPTI